MSTLQRWLENIGLDEYVGLFEKNRIGFDILPDLNEVDFEKLNIPLGDRKRLLNAISELRTYPKEQNAAKSNEHSLTERAERRQLTLLFADLVDSTLLSERLDLEEYRALIKTVHETFARAIREHNGWIAQYQGDGVFAYFGYPEADEDDAERAAAAGLSIVDAVRGINSDSALSLQVRVGIATGLVVVGNLTGDGINEKNTVMGEVPNLASRIQSLAEPDMVLVSDITRRLLGNQFVCQDTGLKSVRGLTYQVRLWWIKETKHSPSRFESRLRGALTAFVGQDDELALLNRRWDQAKTGNGQVALISGEPGIGKSRLTLVLDESIAEQPHSVLRYQCSPHHMGSALQPIIVQIEAAAGFKQGDAPEQKLEKLELLIAETDAEPGKTVPVLAHLLSIPAARRYAPLEGTPKKLKELILNTLLDQLVKLAAHNPVLIIFEDLHWIDPTSQQLFDLLVDNIHDIPVLAVATYRPEFIAPWVGHAHVSTLNLSRLTAEQSAQVVIQQVGGRRFPDRLIEMIIAKTDGVPLFLEEMTKAVLESDTLRLEGQAYELLDQKADLQMLPVTLHDSLMARLDRLPEAREIAPIGAAIGRTFTYTMLAKISGISAHALESGLNRLKEAQLLFEHGAPPDSRYTFKHALIQDVAYETLLSERRRELHAKIAAILRSEFTDSAAGKPELLAHHYNRANMLTEALEYWQKAADQAVQRSANAEAVSNLEAGLDTNSRIGDDSLRIDNEISLREKLCIPLEACGWGSRDIEDNLERLRTLRKERGDRDELFSVLHGLFGARLIGGQISLAQKVANEMLELANQSDKIVFHVLSQHANGMCRFFAGAFRKAVEHFSKAISLYDSSNNYSEYYVADPKIVAHCMRAWAYAFLGDVTKSDESLLEAVHLVEGQDHLFTRAYGFGIIASIHQTRGDSEACLQYADLSLQISRDNSYSYWEAWAQTVRGWALCASGKHREGISELRAGKEKYKKTGSKLILTYINVLMADALLRAQRRDEGLRFIDEIEAEQTKYETQFYTDSIKAISKQIEELARGV